MNVQFTARCEEVIVTDLSLIGEGKYGNPYRRAVEVWAKDGTLIARNDPSLRRMIEEFAATLSDDKGSELIEIIKYLHP